jgi:hypothetical protein
VDAGALVRYAPRLSCDSNLGRVRVIERFCVRIEFYAEKGGWERRDCNDDESAVAKSIPDVVRMEGALTRQDQCLNALHRVVTQCAVEFIARLRYGRRMETQMEMKAKHVGEVGESVWKNVGAGLDELLATKPRSSVIAQTFDRYGEKIGEARAAGWSWKRIASELTARGVKASAYTLAQVASERGIVSRSSASKRARHRNGAPSTKAARPAAPAQPPAERSGLATAIDKGRTVAAAPATTAASARPPSPTI